MALDHRERVDALAVFDVVPTGEVWARTDASLALTYWHWAFLAQPAPLPERLIADAPEAFFDLHVRTLGLGRAPDRYPADLMAAYRRLLDNPSVVQAICEDYRAGAGLDRDHDDAERAARRIECPLLALERPRCASAAVRRRARGVAPVGADGDRPGPRGKPFPRRGPAGGGRPELTTFLTARASTRSRVRTPIRRPNMSTDATPNPQPRDELAGKLKRTELQHAASSIPGREIVQVLTEIPAGVESGWHQHPGEEVGYIVVGSVRMEIEGQSTLILNAGDPFLIPPRTPHNALDLGPETGRMLSTYIVEVGQPIATFVST